MILLLTLTISYRKTRCYHIRITDSFYFINIIAFDACIEHFVYGIEKHHHLRCNKLKMGCEYWCQWEIGDIRLRVYGYGYVILKLQFTDVGSDVKQPELKSNV